TTDGASIEVPATPGEYLAWLQSSVNDLENAALIAEAEAAIAAGTAADAAQTAAADAAIVAGLEAQLAELPPLDPTAIEAERQAALADNFPWAQDRIDDLGAQIAALPNGPEKSALQSEQTSLQLNLLGLLFGIPSSVNWYTGYINDFYDAQIVAGGGGQHAELQSQIAAAEIVAAASQQAAADAQIAADEAQDIAAPLRAEADQAQADLDAVIADPYYAFAAYLQGIADQRDAEADLAEGAA